MIGKPGVGGWPTFPSSWSGDMHEHGNGGAMTSMEQRIADLERENGLLRRFSVAVDQSPACIVVTDRQGSIEYVNPKFLELTGYEITEALGKNPRILKSGTTSPAEYQELWATINSGRTWHGEFCNRKKNGELYWESAAISPIVDGQGNITHFVAIKQDITERKRVETERSQAEVKLARLHQQNELILSSAAEGILGLDLQGNHTFVNPAAARMLGYEVDELLGCPSHALWHHTKADGGFYPRHECPIFATLRDGQTHRSDAEVFWRKDGSRLSVEYASTPIHEQGQLVGAVVTFADLTERQRAEHELRTAKDFLDSVVNAIADPVFVKDDQRRFVLVNDAFCAIDGRPRDAILLNDGDASLPEEQAAVFRKMDVSVLESGEESVSEEFLRNRSSGEVCTLVTRKTRYTDPAGKRFIVAVTRDITERKRTETELRTAKDFLDGIVNTIADPVFVKDDQRRFVLVNDALCAIVGRPRAALLGEDGDDMFPVDQVAVFRNMDDGVLATGEENLNEESLSDLSSGEVRTIITRKTRHIDPAGKRFLVGVIRDISARKRAEVALAASETRYRTLFEKSRDALMTLAPPSWSFTSANPATVALFGARDEADLISRGPWQVSPERQPDGRPSADKAKAMIETAMREGSHFFDWTHRRVSGEDFPATVLLTRIEVDGQAFLQATVRDET